MRYIKKFESENKKFTDWLKNPKRPIDKFEYIFSCTANNTYDLIDTGSISMKDLITYIGDNGNSEMWGDIAEDSGISISNLKRDNDISDDAINNYFESKYMSMGFWKKFLDEYINHSDILNEKDYDYIISLFNKQKEEFENDEAWFRLYEMEIIYPNGVRKYTKKRESYEKVYFKATVSKPLNKEDIIWLIDYISNAIDNTLMLIDHDTNIKKTKIPVSNGSTLHFDTYINIKDDIKLIYPTIV